LNGEAELVISLFV